jgi:hypothetical protein
MSSRSAELHAWRFPVNERWISAQSASNTHATLERQGRRADSSEGSMAQLNPTSDTDTTAAIDSGA